MDTIGFWIFMLFLGFVGYLIYFLSRSDGEEGKHTPTTPGSVSPPAPPKPQPVPVKQKEGKYVTIYEFYAPQSIVRCAMCDGENPHGTKVCRICGNEMDS